jgi:hypothetical protein
MSTSVMPERRTMRDPDEGLTPDGLIRTGVRRDRVPADFEPVLAAVVDSFEEIGDGSAELHLYGSVATGMARVGRSDVDLIAIGVPADWARETSARLSARFADLCRGVAIGEAQHTDCGGDGDEAYGWRVFLRHYCVPVAAARTAARAAPVPGDRRAARGLNGDIALHLARWRAARSADARRVARKVLLAAAGVISVHDLTWTTDRGTAAHRWATLEPDRAADMVTLLGWTEDARRASPGDVAAVIGPDGIVAAVADRFGAEVGFWR